MLTHIRQYAMYIVQSPLKVNNILFSYTYIEREGLEQQESKGVLTPKF